MAQLKNALVVVPTYNEAGTIKELVERTFKAAESIPDWNVWVLVVDDMSPDGTRDIVHSLAYPDGPHRLLSLISNPQKRGIGYAYMRGYRIANADKIVTYDVIIEMDADLQHPPEMIPSFLRKIDEGYDLVIGSRKITGGENSISRRGLWRYLLTEVGGLIVRLALLFPSKYFWQVTDPTSGFRATRVKGFADQLDFHRLVTLGFAFKYDTLYQLARLKAEIAEIPLDFQNRTYGESKMGSGAIREALTTIFKIRLNLRPD